MKIFFAILYILAIGYPAYAVEPIECVGVACSAEHDNGPSDKAAHAPRDVPDAPDDDDDGNNGHGNDDGDDDSNPGQGKNKGKNKGENKGKNK